MGLKGLANNSPTSSNPLSPNAGGTGSSVAAIAVPRRNSTIVLEGHSFVANNSTPQSYFGSAGVAPASNAGYTYSFGVFEQAMIAANYPFRVLANNGVSGNTTAQILTRIPGDLALNPGWMYLDCLTNDALTNVPLSTTIANVTSMLQQCNAANVAVILALDGPRDSNTPGTAMTQAEIALSCEASNYFKDYAFSHPNIIIFDQAPFRWDTTSVANSEAYTPLASVVESDGVHPNPYGAWLSGTQGTLSLKALLQPYLWGNQFYTGPSGGSDGSSLGDTQNIVTNPLMCGTSGTIGTGASGTAPTSYTVSRAGSGTTTVTSSIVTRASLASTFPGLYDDGAFGNVTKMVITGGTSLTTNDSGQLAIPFSQSTLTSGSGPWEYEVEVAGTTSSGTIAEFQSILFVYNSGGGYNVNLNWDVYGWGSDPLGLTKFQGKLRSRPFYLPPGTGGGAAWDICASPSIGGTMNAYISNPKWRLLQA